MKRPRSPVIVAISAALLCAPAVAQDTEQAAVPSNSVPVVEANDIKNPEWKTYRAMLKGLDAFDEHRRLAPAADLRFILLSAKPEVPLQGVSLRIAGGETSIAIPVADDGTFTLPHDRKAADDNAEIVLNRKKDMVRWFPHIRSPGLPPNARRLGDLRLECEIFWAIEKDDVPFLIRGALNLAGGPCRSAISTYFPAPRALAAATLQSGERRQALTLGKNGRSYVAPIHDRGWSDDALVELTYAEDEKTADAATGSAVK
ncbi:MAG TPA: hypothetical protein VEC06_07600 [Paucimonas sp.]|nr:hypothetical protein [Paucimonas sp.]